MAAGAGITDGSGIALLAVGSYGRRDLCPGSDLDLTIVHRVKSDAASAAAEAVWYPVWDTGVGLDHSVRNLKQALGMAEDDLKVALGLLDARLVAGDLELASQLFDGAAERWRRRASRWLGDLAGSVAQRHHQFGEIAFLLEPDLKEGRGGLRDVTALGAAAAASPVVEDPRRNPALVEAHEILLSVRVELHRQTGRAQDRLLLQEQDRAAATLGYTDADELMKAVASAARTVAATSDDAWRRVASWLAGPKGRTAGNDRPLAPGVVLRDGEVVLSPGADPSTDPWIALRAATAAAEAGAPLARSCLERLSAGVPAEVPAPWPATARNALVALLGTGRPAIAALEALDGAGVLARLLPEWEPVRNRPQRNAYHRFTVDRHLSETAANAAELVRRVRRPDLLLVGAWMHDIGKGYPGDHTDSGIEVVRRVGARLGFEPADVETLVAMVRHHLLLPDAATRRDLDDPATVEAVAAAVEDSETLELLAVLAEADGRATGPAAWGPWKAGLVETLVRRTEGFLRGAPPEPPSGLPTDEHRRLMADGGLHVIGEGDTLTLVAPDRPGLLSAAAGVLALHGLGILAASAASEGAMAVEVFQVEVPPDRPIDPEAVGRDLEAALDGRLPLEPRLAERERASALHRRPGAARPAEPRVIVDNDASGAATVVEVRSPDAVGVLHRITRTLAEEGLDVVTAKVSTLGHEVVDAFYVRDGDGRKITDADRLGRLEAALMEALSPD